ncbi:MAG: hypothetical protein JWN13_1237 [Betaproteobacteria bacterium]|jgi:hypothetical protein|nr:hypothetical protein [Betaproteobacteria bacterium]
MLDLDPASICNVNMDPWIQSLQGKLWLGARMTMRSSSHAVMLDLDPASIFNFNMDPGLAPG